MGQLQQQQTPRLLETSMGRPIPPGCERVTLMASDHLVVWWWWWWWWWYLVVVVVAVVLLLHLRRLIVKELT